MKILLSYYPGLRANEAVRWVGSFTNELRTCFSLQPIYVFRELNDMKTGKRTGAGVALMNALVDQLTQDDMVAIAAYLGSRDP